MSELTPSEAAVDALTGLPFRSGWLGSAGERAGADEEGRYGVLLIDIDHLATLNEAHGHEAGDYAVASAASFFGEFFGSYATLYRYAGDCFLAVLPGATAEQSVLAAENLLKALAARTFPLPDGEKSMRLMVSVGVASAPENGATPAELVGGARIALAQCKRAGRGQVQAAPGSPGSLLLGEQFHLYFPARRWFERGGVLAGILDRLAGEAAEPLFLVTGSMGAGKSRLLREVGSRLGTAGVAVFSADCSTTTRIQPFGALIPGIRKLLAGSPDRLERVRARLDEGQVFELATLVPEFIALRNPDFKPEGSLAQRRQVLLDAFIAILDEATAGSNLVLLLDNMQWSDLGTLRILDSLHATSLGARTTALMAVDSTAKGNASFDEFVDRHKARDELYQLALPPLSREEMHAYLPDLVPPIAGLEALEPELMRSTSGNPLLLEETLRFLVTRRFIVEGPDGLRLNDVPPNVLPDSLGNAVTRRTEHLPAGCRSIVSRAAVMGHTFTLASLEKLTGRPAVDLLEPLDLACEALILTRSDEEGTYTYVSEAARLSFYNALSDGERRETHEKIGTLEEELMPGTGDSALARIAFHYEQAGNIEKSLEFVSRIARTYQEFVTPRSIEVVVGRLPDLKDWGSEGKLTAEQEQEVHRALGMMRLSIRNMDHLTASSPITGATLDACFSQLDRILTAAGGVSVTFAPDSLILNGTETPHFEGGKELFGLFNGHRLAGAVFRPGMDRRQLEDFISLLLMPREKVDSLGGWTKAMRAGRITHIVANERILIGVAEKDLFDPAKLREASAVTVRSGSDAPRAAPASDDPIDRIEEELHSLRSDGAVDGTIVEKLENIGKFLEEIRRIGALVPRQQAAPAAAQQAEQPLIVDRGPSPRGGAQEDDPWFELANRYQKADLMRLLSITRMMDIAFLDYLQTAPESLVRDLESPEKERVTAAAMGLWGLGEKAGRWLIPYLSHSDHPRGRKAAQYLMRSLVPGFQAHMMRAVVESRSPEEQEKLTESLADMGVPWAGDVMTVLLHDPAPAVRRNAARVLLQSALDLQVKAEVLKEITRSENLAVARDAVRALGTLPLPEAVEDLAVLLKRRWLKREDEAAVALLREVCLALGSIGSRNAVPVLAEVLFEGAAAYLMGKRDASVRAAAAWALGRIADEEATRTLERCLKDQEPTVRAAARLALQNRAGGGAERKADFDEVELLKILEEPGEGP